MEIFYGANIKIIEPKIIIGKYTKDFGNGFYCTTIRSQAEKWAKKYPTPIVNIYEYTEDNDMNILKFHTMTDEWLDFIASCRSGNTHNYDIVIGPMADDQVYNYVSDYIEGTISREAFWTLAKFKYPTQQIVFCTQKSLQSIKFIKSYEV